MNARALAVLVLCPLAAAQVELEVRIAGALGASIADALRSDLGAQATVAVVSPSAQLRAGIVAVGFDCDPMRGSAATSVPLPWVVRYALVARSEVPPAAEAGLDALALQPMLQDRLAVCAPDVDPGPWLLGMAEALARGQEENGGYGLWTALDARVASYPADAAAAMDAVRSGSALATLLPRPVLASLGVPGDCRVAAIGTVDALGLGVVVVPPAGSAAAEVVRRLAAIGRDSALAAICSPREQASAATLASEDVSRWLEHYDARIRGNGRKVERVADVLDTVFTVLFFGILAAFWWRHRRHAAAASGDEPPPSG